jgi:hypothetical protein
VGGAASEERQLGRPWPVPCSVAAGHADPPAVDPALVDHPTVGRAAWEARRANRRASLFR